MSLLPSTIPANKNLETTPQKFSKWEPFLLVDPLFFGFHFFQCNNSTTKLMNKKCKKSHGR